MSDEGDGWQRLDKWLWCARFLKHRADCAHLVREGRVRINRQPTDKPHARLRPQDVLTLPLRNDVIVLRVLALAARRGPANEARTLYQSLADPSFQEPALQGAGNDCIPPPSDQDAAATRSTG